ncbi:MAG: PaaI family thioesterase [Thermoanaerobaculaceae bacterium]
MNQRFPAYPGCPVCGDPNVNPHALGVRWEWDGDASRVVGQFVPGPHHLGYENRMHGGILSALLDEAMAWACAVRVRSYCVTGELQVRFKAAAAVGRPIEISARADGDGWGPYVRSSGEARAADGTLVAVATATFAAVPRDEARRLRRALAFAPGDLDVLAEE